jgi:hypothetical protein
MHEEGVDGRLRMAAHLRFGPQVLHELAEIAAALLRMGSAGGKRRRDEPREKLFLHCRLSSFLTQAHAVGSHSSKAARPRKPQMAARMRVVRKTAPQTRQSTPVAASMSPPWPPAFRQR